MMSRRDAWGRIRAGAPGSPRMVRRPSAFGSEQILALRHTRLETDP